MFSSCESNQTGYIYISSPENGKYEIYHVTSETPLQFISEQIGNFNEAIALQPGSYLVLADCSSEIVVIHPNKSKRLVAHAIHFSPPIVPQAQDLFSIQCNRFDKTKSRQYIQNKYSLIVLSGKRELLVGNVPLTLSASEFEDQSSAKTINFDLAALRIDDKASQNIFDRYFVSPLNDQISLTESQAFGFYQFLLPGSYKIELNGTKMEIHLERGEYRTVFPAFLQVNTTADAHLELSSQIKGSPLYVEINGDHWLDLNQVYSVLPGHASIRLNGTFRAHQLEFNSNETVVKEARSVRVDLDCSPWEWSCLGGKEVFLYKGQEAYPFSEGVTDVPRLFFEDDVWVSIGGSQEIKYHLSDKKRDQVIKIGRIKFIPTHKVQHGIVTDLVRLETIREPYAGYSLDIQLDEESTLLVIEGLYYLASYVSSTVNESDRRKSRKQVNINSDATLEMNFDVFVTEKKFRQLQLQKEKKQKQILASYKRHLNQYQPSHPLKYR